MGTNFPHEQQICLFAAAEISSSYLATDVRMCEQEISGGNASEATAELVAHRVGKKALDLNCPGLSPGLAFFAF